MLELEKANTRYTKRDDDEIDLIELILRAALFIKKHLVLFITLIVVGIAIGVLLYLKTPKYYEARMIATSGVLSNVEVINIVESWQVHINKGDYSILANKLGLSTPTVQKLQFIEAENTGKPEQKAAGQEQKVESFTISVQVVDVKILDSLQLGIVKFLENNEYVRRRSALKKVNLEHLKSRIDREIASLDSIKASLSNLLSNGRPTSGTFLTDPTNVNLRIIEFYERALEIDTAIKLINDVQVIEDFTRSDTPDGPKLIKYIGIGALVGFLLCSFVIFIIFINNKLSVHSMN
jgi:hypothetical protein